MYAQDLRIEVDLRGDRADNRAGMVLIQKIRLHDDHWPNFAWFGSKSRIEVSGINVEFARRHFGSLSSISSSSRSASSDDSETRRDSFFNCLRMSVLFM